MKRIILAAFCIALLAAACGSGSGDDAEFDPDSSQPTIVVSAGKLLAKIWFVNDGRLVAVQREVDDLDDDTNQAAAVTEQLLSGPLEREGNSGFVSLIPAGVEVLQISTGNAFHSLDLSSNFTQEAPESELAMRLAQLGCTITANGPDQVLISVEGGIPQMSATLDLSAPVTCSMLTTALGSVSSGPENPNPSEQPAGVPAEGVSLDIVFVDPENTLPLRQEPGFDSLEISAISPAAPDLIATGRSAEVDEVRWVEVMQAENTGWVHSGFVTEVQTTFAEDERPERLLFDLAAAWSAGEGGEEFVAENGLWIAHFDEPRRFPSDQLESLVNDPTPMQWGSPGCAADECGPLTFSEAISEALVSSYTDDDSAIFLEPIAGPGGTPAEFVIPPSFANAPYLAIYDPGDAEFENLNWTTWYVYFVYLGGEPKVAGLSVDMWSP
jgi:Sporulation and spore germination